MAHQIYEQSPINTDPREQRNYQMYSHSGRSRTPRLIRNLALTLIILGAIATGLTFYGLTAPRTAAILPEHTFNVSGHTELIVNNDAGSIHIHSASTNSIVVHGTKYASGIGPDVNAIDVQYEQQGNSVFVTSKEGWGIAGSRSVDLDITVPTSLDVKVANASGSITIDNVTGNVAASTMSGGINAENVNGEMSLSTVSGGIQVHQAQLHGPSVLKAGSGGIDIDNVSGEMTLSAASGGIQAHQVQLHGSSVLKTDSGDINFTGSLDQQGNYRMETASGGIHLTLPANTSFHLDASTISGHVTNDFGTTTTGDAPQPDLSLHADSGSITVNKQ